jgi:hypothetical protein
VAQLSRPAFLSLSRSLTGGSHPQVVPYIPRPSLLPPMAAVPHPPLPGVPPLPAPLPLLHGCAFKAPTHTHPAPPRPFPSPNGRPTEAPLTLMAPHRRNLFPTASQRLLPFPLHPIKGDPHPATPRASSRSLSARTAPPSERHRRSPLRRLDPLL